MTRKETIDKLGEHEGYYTRALIGKAYDSGREEALVEGYREGFKDANKYASKVMIACSCLALHDLYGFGAQRMQRFAAAFRDKLLNTLEGQEAVKEIDEKFGIVFDDEVFEDDEDV